MRSCCQCHCYSLLPLKSQEREFVLNQRKRKGGKEGEERRQETHSGCGQHFLFPPVPLLNILGTQGFNFLISGEKIHSLSSKHLLSPCFRPQRREPSSGAPPVPHTIPSRVYSTLVYKALLQEVSRLSSRQLRDGIDFSPF